MGSTLLLALSGLAPSHAFAPAGEVYQGIEPSRTILLHKERQHQLRNDKAWTSFTQGAGQGWKARFDEQAGTPMVAWGPGIAIDTRDQASVEADLRQLLIDHPTLAGVSDGELEATRVHYHAASDSWMVHFDRLIDGTPIWRGGVDFIIRFDKLVQIRVQTHPDAVVKGDPQLHWSSAANVAVEQGPEPDLAHDFEQAFLVVLPTEKDNNTLGYRLTWEVHTSTRDVPGYSISHVDAMTGELINVYNNVRFVDGTVLAYHDTRTVDGDYSTSGVPLASVSSNNGSVETDSSGGFDLGGSSFETDFDGKWLRVGNEQGSDAEATFSGAEFTWTTDKATQAEIDTYVFLHQTRAWTLEYAPENDMVTSSLRSYVNLNSSCNAYYDGNVNFYRSGSGCNNTGRIADVNHHEFGHGFHAMQAGSWYVDGSVGEGAGDILAFLFSDDPVIAPYFATNGSGIRRVDTNYAYPDDVSGEVHQDGLIWAGAVWDFLKLMEDEVGNASAHDVTSRLYADALVYNPDIPGTYDAFVAADDDDGNLGNGTPNTCIILEAFEQHGLGPDGGMGVVSVNHVTTDVVSPAEGLQISAELNNMAEDCIDFELASAEVRFSTDGGLNWDSRPMSEDGDVVSADFGDIPAGTVVHYLIEAESTEGDVYTSPSHGDIAPHSVLIGAMDTIYFEDFENGEGGYTHALLDGEESSGADDWQRGTPQGKADDPAFAWSGDYVWGNDMGWDNYNGADWNGEYQPDKHNRLNSPEIDISEAQAATFLQFRRWLNVEDGYYDEATLLIDGEEVWSNHGTGSNDGDEHTVDDQWMVHTVELVDADGDGFVTISWDIESDGGLEFGGWNIDDVAIYSLDVTDPANIPEDDPRDDNPGVDPGEEKLVGSCACSSTQPPVGAGFGLFLLGLGLIWRRRS